MDSDQEQAKVEAERAVTRSGYRKLMDQIADKEEDIVDVNGENNHLLQFLQNNEELYDKVDAPQEAVMDAVVVKQLSKLCKKQAENMSTKYVLPPYKYHNLYLFLFQHQRVQSWWIRYYLKD